MNVTGIGASLVALAQREDTVDARCADAGESEVAIETLETARHEALDVGANRIIAILIG